MNHLQNELSPYLLQHKNNPVDWYPWCDEAFELAKKLNKPIFLSIGYSTCHWCHVMEKESFEDTEASEILNDVFICIKVDREERPDIDAVYMRVCQMLTGSGGWPLTILMTPNKKPFFAGTYFPKNASYGRIGVIELAQNVKILWKKNPETIEKATNEIMLKISEYSKNSSYSYLDGKTLDKAFEELKLSYDSRYGGFSHSPKFPAPHNLTFLLRYFHKTKNPIALEMCENTLNNMGYGGIYDHIGFGFHRYSTDERWLVPHFEKMLYDQALLIIAYSEAYQLTKNKFFKRIANEVIEYVVRDMMSPEDAFFSAEDADSEGEEGKYYLWTYDEIISILEKPEIFIDAYGILPNGNYIEGYDEKSSGKNIIYRLKTNEELAKKYNLPEKDIGKYIDDSLKILFSFRTKRIKPFKDDKILTDWNSLMISALAKAGSIFNNSYFISIAKKTEEFIWKKLINENGQLLHIYRNGVSSIPALLDDYAYLIWAEIELYEATSNYDYLKKAKDLADTMIQLFYDNQTGGFYITSSSSDDLPLRTKELYDGAIPSGNSVAIFNLVKLWKYFQEDYYKNITEATITFFSNSVFHMPQAYSHFLNALSFYIFPSTEIIIVYSNKDTNLSEIIHLINQFYIPNKIIFFKNIDFDSQNFEFFNKYNKLDNKLTVYICSNFSCKKPVNNIKELEKSLNELFKI